MTILVYSKKKVISQLLIEYIEKHFTNISYCNNICIKQVNEFGMINSLIEEIADEFIIIADYNENYNNDEYSQEKINKDKRSKEKNNWEVKAFFESVSIKGKIILIVNSDETVIENEKSHNIFVCTSLHKLDSFLKDSLEEKVFNNTLDTLTGREREILKLIAKGLLNKEIANELHITERTVKNHISNIFKKINVYDRTQAAVFAIKNKIFSL